MPPPLRPLNLAVCVGFLVAYHVLEMPHGRLLRKRLFAAPAPLRGCAYGLVLVYLMVFVPMAAGAFIYAQF